MPLLLIGALVNSSFADSLASPGMAMLFNALMAVPVYLGLAWEIGHTRSWGIIASLSLFAYGIESLGVLSGWPYGAFHYGKALGPLIFETVPLMLPFTYIPLVLGSAALVRSLSADRRRRIWLAALALTAFDLLLDPGATKLGFWIWHDSGIYYGVPSSNFLGWLLSSYLVMRLLDWLSPKTLKFRHPYFAFTYFWGCVFWTAVSVFKALWIPAVIGLGLGLLSATWIRSRLPKSSPIKLTQVEGAKA